MLIHHAKTGYTLEDVAAVARGEAVELAPETRALLDDRRRQVEAYVAETRSPSYGFNRGFGHNVDQPVAPDRCGELQENLLRSHAAGVGEHVPREVVRATLFIRALSLSRGHSAVRPIVIDTLVAMLNRGVTPCVPRYGSVGASGDLAPLSHIGLVMLKRRPGEGPDDDERAWIGDRPDPVPAEQAMAEAGIPRISLAAKEGLAFNNGAGFSTALAGLACLRAEDLLKTAAVATAMSTQVLLGADSPFRADVHALRPHAGAGEVAGWIARLLDGSPLIAAHRPYDIDGEVQDPYSIRCAAQVLGACLDLLFSARRTLEVEIDSVTDNPLILPLSAAEAARRGEDPRWIGQFVDIVSAGHFHGMPVAVAAYNVLQTLGIAARLSNMRCARYVDGRRNKGMNEDLKWRDEWQDPSAAPGQDALSSGMMVPEYVSASLTNAIWGAMMPSHLLSISTDAGQEDHVSMSATLAIRLWDTLPRLAEVLAIELAFATQAAAIRRRADGIPSKITLTAREQEELSALRDDLTREARRLLSERFARPLHDVRCDFTVSHPLDEPERLLSPACEAVRARVAERFPTVTRDRYLSRQLRDLAAWVGEGGPVRAVEEALGGRL